MNICTKQLLKMIQLRDFRLTTRKENFFKMLFTRKVIRMGNALIILTERFSMKMNTKMLRDKNLLFMIKLDKSSVSLK